MKQTLALLSGVLTMSAAAVAEQPVVLYENFNTDLGLFLDETTLESGDQVTLPANVPRVANSFTFEYFLKPTAAVGNETVRIRFYENDGPALSATDPSRMPGTLFYDSGPLALTQTGQAKMTLNDFAMPFPDTFTWTAQFEGGRISDGQVAGLELYSPPTVGTSPWDFWQKNGNTWETFYWDEFCSDFGARLELVPIPEPSTVVFLLGGIGAVAARVRRSRRPAR